MADDLLSSALPPVLQHHIDDLLPSSFSALPPVLQHHIIWAANGSLAARRVNREVLELHDRSMQRTAKLLPPRDVLSRVPSSIVKRVLLERWPALENLSLQKAEIDDETVALLLGERPQLRSLNLDRCSGLTMATLQLLHSLSSSSSSSSSPSLSDDGDGADEGKADAGLSAEDLSTSYAIAIPPDRLMARAAAYKCFVVTVYKSIKSGTSRGGLRNDSS